jgi:predicted restriction endonuclease
LKKGIIEPAYRCLDNKNIKISPVPPITYNILQLAKLINNIQISKTNKNAVIERDNYQCQVCGFDDIRTLEVHHIIPKSSPFFTREWIQDPINLITVCTNDHRIIHRVIDNEVIYNDLSLL